MDLEPLEGLTRRAQARDLEAFGELTRRFQHMALGYALSMVRDLAQAEDVVQEAFVAAWFALPTLAEPAAFPGWLRGIVRHQALRVVRRPGRGSLPLDAAAEVEAGAGPGGRPDDLAERRQRLDGVLAAIAGLPRTLREVVSLFYVHECSQQDIATFLGLPVSTVNNRLHAARTQLKRRMLAMVKDTLESHQLPDDFAARIGRIVRARERVIEARFDPAAMPAMLSELTVSDEARQRAVPVQVVQRRPDGVVRAVATASTEVLAAGMSVLSSGHPVRTPVSRDGFARLVEVLAGRPSAGDEPPRLLETGIKVIDVMCPLVAGGTVAMAGEYAAGTVVQVEELVRRLSAGAERLSIFALVPGPMSTSLEETWQKDGYSDGTVGAVETFFFLREEEPWTDELLAALTGVDTVIRLSTVQSRTHRIYPPVDPLTSRSRLLDERRLEPEHLEVAEGVRRALALLADGAEGAADRARDAGDERLRARARKLRLFFAQPYFSAEPYTKLPGVAVPLAVALRDCRAILDGAGDDLPEEAFSFTGTLEDVRRKARGTPA